MNYFGIKTPQRDNEAPYIWWIASSQHEAWMSFFQYPSAKREMNAHRLPLAEAIQAYEAVGYRCVAVDVQEKHNDEGKRRCSFVRLTDGFKVFRAGAKPHKTNEEEL